MFEKCLYGSKIFLFESKCVQEVVSGFDQVPNTIFSYFTSFDRKAQVDSFPEWTADSSGSSGATRPYFP